MKFEVDETIQYSKLNFEFCPDHRLTVWNDILSYPGKWNIIAGNPDRLQIDLEINVDKLAHYWADLENDWQIIKMTDDLIQLQNDDMTKELVFQRKSK